MSFFNKKEKEVEEFNLLKKYALPGLNVYLEKGTLDSDLPTVDKYGGRPARSPELPWPCCGKCGEPQQFIAQFSLNDSFWRFFECDECSPWSNEDMQKGLCVLERESEEALLSLQAGPTEKSTSFPEYRWNLKEILAIPGFGDTFEMDSKEDERNLRKELYKLDDMGDLANECLNKLGLSLNQPTLMGGYPNVIQDTIEIQCPHCEGDMVHMTRLGSLSSHLEISEDHSWGDMGAVFLLFCPEHFHLEGGVGFEMQCS